MWGQTELTDNVLILMYIETLLCDVFYYSMNNNLLKLFDVLNFTFGDYNISLHTKWYATWSILAKSFIIYIIIKNNCCGLEVMLFNKLDYYKYFFYFC